MVSNYMVFLPKKNPMSRRCWQSTVQRVTKSQTQLSTHAPKVPHSEDHSEKTSLLFGQGKLTLLKYAKGEKVVLFFFFSFLLESSILKYPRELPFSTLRPAVKGNCFIRPIANGGGGKQSTPVPSSLPMSPKRGRGETEKHL